MNEKRFLSLFLGAKVFEYVCEKYLLQALKSVAY